jgi:uncharacterized membrane protein YgdD (TMEM256/DUF423 family)
MCPECGLEIAQSSQSATDRAASRQWVVAGLWIAVPVVLLVANVAVLDLESSGTSVVTALGCAATWGLLVLLAVATIVLLSRRRSVHAAVWVVVIGAGLFSGVLMLIHLILAPLLLPVMVIRAA